MAMYALLGKFSAEAMRGMSAARTQQAEALVKQFGGTVKGMYALLGEKDLLLLLDLPDVKAAMKVSIALSKLTGIGFTTSPAVTVEELDILASGV